MAGNFEVSEISLKNRKTSEVLADQYWGTWYFLFPFFVLTKTENTVLYGFLFGMLVLVFLGFSRYVLPVLAQAPGTLTELVL